MKHIIPYSVILLVLLYGMYNATRISKPNIQSPTSNKNYKIHTATHTGSHIKDELQQIETTAYMKHYIIQVINHGSSQLHFKPQEVMEGGFASREDAPKIACYVLSLGGDRCDTPCPKDAAMYYSSNCAGCHGDDGRGLHGTYPDLTRRPLLGIRKRKTLLQRMLHKP
jgi:hypothetical protein